MASKLAKVVMTLDGQRVEVGLDKIREKTRQMKTEMHNLAMEGKQNTKEYKDRQKAVEKLHKAEEDVVEVTKRINTYMKELGNVATTDLRRAYREGIQLREGFKGTDKELQKLNADLAAIKAQIDKNTGATTAMTKAQQGFAGALGTTLKNLTAYVGVFAAFNKAKSMVEGVFKANMELSDSLANIRKVSGLTAEEVNKVYTNIAKIDSRNTIETLNQLAYTGAKLGIGQNYGVSGLTGFVKAAEQVQMALGEDMGEDALPALAKMAEVMGLINKYGVEQAMQKTASAIFQLGATSTATGTNIVEFSKRLYGLANVSNVTADELLGLGSAADAMGLMPEVASTAFNKLFTSLQTNHNLIEKTLSIPKGTINELYSAGKTMDAIVLVLEKMKEQGNLNALGGVWKDLGSNGARLINVMATMSDRVDMLKTHLDTSRKAFKDGTAVINEYLIQNETAAALAERASNLWAKAFTNPQGVDMVKEFAEQWYNVSKNITQSEAAMYSMKATIQWIAGAIGSLVTMLPQLIKLLTWIGIFGGFRTLALSVMSLIANLRAATTATMTLTAALRSNVILVGISAVAAGISLWVDKMNAAEEAAERLRQKQDDMNKSFQESKVKIEESTSQLESCKKAIDKLNVSQGDRDKLLRQALAGDYQDYLDYLGIEIDSAYDLAEAYAKVVEVMKQKKAYEEREQYRDEVNGENKIERMRSGAKFDQTMRSIGLEGYDQAWLKKNQHKPTWQIYDEIIKKKYGMGLVKTSGAGETYYYDPKTKKRVDKDWRIFNSIANYQRSYRAERNTNMEVDELYKNDVGNFDMEKFQEEVTKAQLKRKGGLEKEKPDKAALAAARKAAQEHKAALRKELKDAQADSDAIISKIEEWYRLQETVVTDMQADGKLTKEQAEQVLRTLNIEKNRALGDARKAISGRDTKSWEETKKHIGDLMLDQGDWSSELLQEILDVNIEHVRTALGRIDKEGKSLGITSTAMRDKLDKNAAGNDREIARLRVKSQEEVEKILLEFHYVETAIKGFSDRLAQMGILSETAQHLAEKLTDANNVETPFSEKDLNKILADNEKAKRDMLQAFINSGTQKYAVNPEDTESLDKWLRDFMGMQFKGIGAKGAEFGFESWAEPFRDDFNLWLRESNTYKDKIQAFYFSLVKSEDDYYDAMKKAYQKQKTLFAQRWENSGQAELFDEYGKALSLRQRKLSMTGRDNGTNFVDVAGFSNLNEDPEIAASMLRMEQAQRELEMFREVARQKKMEGEELAAFQKNLREKEMAATEAEMGMQETLMKSINDRISKLQDWLDPIQEFGTEVGRALYDQWHNGESMTAKWQDMLKKMGLAWGQLTVKIVSELMMEQIKQKMIHKAMQTEETTHQATMGAIEQAGGQARATIAETTGDAKVVAEQTTDTIIEGEAAKHGTTMLAEETGQAAAENPVNISRAAGKTLADLGWWGIPLVAVITALLNMLLQAALGTSKSSSNKSSSSTKDATKMKLVSGMLTYDKGNVGDFARGDSTSGRLLPTGRKNVQRFIGQDGKVYTATEEPAPRDGLITHPIATTVQGQPALVAEKGPEIVIGRETTRAIMMNEPELIRYLANYQQQGGRRLYDSGNLSEYSEKSDYSEKGAAAMTAADARALVAAIGTFNQTVADMQKKGIPCYINKYGSGGLIDEVQSGMKFMSRYGG